jgi:hypothetical protein
MIKAMTRLHRSGHVARRVVDQREQRGDVAWRGNDRIKGIVELWSVRGTHADDQDRGGVRVGTKAERRKVG